MIALDSEAELRRRYRLRETAVRLPGHLLPFLAASVDDADGQPLWTRLWPGGLALAGYLIQGPPPRGPVLELGAGLGLAGIAVALTWGRVVQTDCEPDALRTARLNAARCGVAGRVIQVAADWRAWPLRGEFGLAIAGDVTYDAALHQPLLDALGRSLRSGGMALIADPDRPASHRFVRRLRAGGWRVTEYPVSMPDGSTCGLLRALAP